MHSTLANLISIIIPVYNAEKQIKRTIDSVICQSYGSLQIICIDDGSTDESLRILKEYAADDSRIEVYTQSNRGCSAARNFGLDHVKGEYLMFVDADDWMDSNTCKRAISIMESEQSDLVMWSYYKEYGIQSSPVRVWNRMRIFEKNDMHTLSRRILGLRPEEMNRPELMDSLGTLWGKLYKSSLFLEHKLRFVDLDKIGSAEDVLANLYATTYAMKAVFIPECLYHYCKTNETSQTKTYRKRLVSQWQALFSEMESWRKTYDSSEESECILRNRISYSLVGLGLNDLSSSHSTLEKFRSISSILHSEWYSHAVQRLDLSYMPLHWKTFFLCAKNKLTIGVYLLLLAIRHVTRASMKRQQRITHP